MKRDPIFDALNNSECNDHDSTPSQQSILHDLLSIVGIGAGLAWLAYNLNPPMMGGRIDWFSALIHLLAGLFCLQAVIRSFDNAAHFIDFIASRRPTGQHGTAAWAALKEIKGALTRDKRGPFCGRYSGASRPALFFDYSSNALTVAPAGSGKGIYTVVPMIMSIRHSKVVADFKGELVCMCKAALEKRGEIVRVLNPGNLWSDIVGQGDAFSPLDIIADDLTRPGGLRDVMADLHEMATQIRPEPGEKESENTYFREGGRQITGFASLAESMMDLFDATLLRSPCCWKTASASKTLHGGLPGSISKANRIQTAHFQSSRPSGRKCTIQGMSLSSRRWSGHEQET